MADAVQVSTDGTNFVNAAVSADGSFTYTTSILSAGSQTITVKAFKGSTVATKTTTVTIAAPAQVLVSSAVAINPKEIKVVFNQEVTQDSANVEANYVLKDNAGATLDPAADYTATLLDDNKTVILTLANPLANNTTYQVATIQNVVSKTNYQKLTKYTSDAKIFTNTDGPALKKVELRADNTLKLTFDKHVSNSMTVKVDGTVVAAAGTVVISTPAADPGVYTAITPAIANNPSLLTTGSHTVVVSDAADLAVPAVTTPVQQMAYGVTADTTAPSVVSATQVGYNSFKVKFSEPINDGGAGNLNTLVQNGNIVVKKGNFTYPQTVAAGVGDGYVSTTAVANEDNTYLITLNDKVTVGGVDYPLYDDGSANTSLSVQIKGFKDAVGLVGTLYNGTVAMTKETVKPYVVSTNLNSMPTTSTFSVKFSENLRSAVADLDATKVSVYDGNNVLVPVAGIGVVNDVLTVTLTGAQGTPAQLYKIVIGAGAVKDIAGNKNDTLTTYVDNRAAATPLTLAQVAATGHGAAIAAGQIGVLDTDKNVITVDFNGIKMGDSAILLANYKLDGAALPVGSKVDFVDAGKDLVKITLPDDIYSVGAVGTLTLSQNIKSDDGSRYIATADFKDVNAKVALSDNIKPVLQSAKFVANTSDTVTNTLQLKFSENLAAVGDDADHTNDFVVIIGGAEYAVTHVTDGTPNDDTVTITLGDTVNVNQAVQVKVVPVGSKNATMDTTDRAALGSGVADSAINTLTEGTTVTVSGKVAP